MKIAPSILSANFANLLEDVKKIEKDADLLHIDVMDGHFVPNITIGPVVVKSLRKFFSIPFDVHLMIENPDLYIEDFVNSGADIITVHQEACIHLHRTIQKIKSYGKKAGVSLNPATPLESIKYVLQDIDMVLIMTVNPGFGGQKFIDSMLKKIEEIKKMREDLGLNFEIEVDGGINLYNVKEVVEAGTDIIVAGSSIFESSDPAQTIKEFRKAVKR
ncbi:ribulose-phosphate 3-epimerase [Thermoanaerobacter sp. CM-CNRG TB177]|uniref:Ribulose-phosphate 3-epimerase n=2 Tax=Thermoanaerobacter TaxID=1754 RepID=D3T2W4_THEIA|nr:MULTISPECIES: ribulose-phosphate 3-epimerase [Thermoanaerobacter]MDI3528227.1 ribulose-phosphate 3-epimerase [Thermoanaerobacter sp.]ADD02566.1 ribulose-phosphate 3-epimerase [Thermoanaerobacter italicus Ab9]MBT1279674.1 ribulose-phosphate 3-epimerase [Thermoanaerobacter sp. CM-CNRG TB177]MDK2814939.1 ribulose-phosphate 3-epimerase [Thermoanaerobacter sp.]MDP9750021.1 ribulose-phosphate 3-epimerase [Thermoanaerobacter pentosaceus]